MKNVINDKKNTSSLKTQFPFNYKDTRVWCKREVTVEGIVFPARIVSHLFSKSMKFRTQKLKEMKEKEFNNWIALQI